MFVRVAADQPISLQSVLRSITPLNVDQQLSKRELNACCRIETSHMVAVIFLCNEYVVNKQTCDYFAQPSFAYIERDLTNGSCGCDVTDDP
jgi:hypothetical protein